jgi:hypothetical protein
MSRRTRLVLEALALVALVVVVVAGILRLVTKTEPHGNKHEITRAVAALESVRSDFDGVAVEGVRSSQSVLHRQCRYLGTEATEIPELTRSWHPGQGSAGATSSELSAQLTGLGFVERERSSDGVVFSRTTLGVPLGAMVTIDRSSPPTVEISVFDENYPCDS